MKILFSQVNMVIVTKKNQNKTAGRTTTTAPKAWRLQKHKSYSTAKGTPLDAKTVAIT
jgi:hypothetical protein